jgi:hypothetical protein
MLLLVHFSCHSVFIQDGLPACRLLTAKLPPRLQLYSWDQREPLIPSMTMFLATHLYSSLFYPYPLILQSAYTVQSLRVWYKASSDCQVIRTDHQNS